MWGGRHVVHTKNTGNSVAANPCVATSASSETAFVPEVLQLIETLRLLDPEGRLIRVRTSASDVGATPEQQAEPMDDGAQRTLSLCRTTDTQRRRAPSR